MDSAGRVAGQAGVAADADGVWGGADAVEEPDSFGLGQVWFAGLYGGDGYFRQTGPRGLPPGDGAIAVADAVCVAGVVAEVGCGGSSFGGGHLRDAAGAGDL